MVGDIALNPASWSYDSDNDVYYQMGLSYVAAPAAEDIETVGVFVPGAYMSATDNGDGTFAATVSGDGAVGEYTGDSAPIVMPINTPGYAGQSAPTEYSYDTISTFMEAGLIYVWPGLRGRDTNSDSYTGNAPWGVTDAKAAIRWYRYNDANLPGDAGELYVFGHSGGGAQSSILGASGDSELYTPYLESLGAAMSDASGATISDAVAGVMAWCPITSLDSANAAYEWNMGQFSTSGTRAEGTWTRQYSLDLAAAWAENLNSLALVDEGGNALTLSESAEGVYLSGTYYDHILQVLTDSLNDFIANTTFPYTPSSTEMAGMGSAPSDSAPSGASQSGSAPSGTPPSSSSDSSSSDSSSSDSTTYNTVEEYIAYLNSDATWVEYNSATGEAKVTSLEGFVNSQKSASKDVGAFDSPDASATENIVMGQGETGLHFDAISQGVISANESTYAALSDWSDDYAASSYDEDVATTDTVGVDVATRLAMYTPLYFLNASYEGYGTSTVAAHWRIRTGAIQGDTSTAVDVNLALAVAAVEGTDVDFATVWGQGHTMAESSGDATSNFIAWVGEVAGS